MDTNELKEQIQVVEKKTQRIVQFGALFFACCIFLDVLSNFLEFKFLAVLVFQEYGVIGMSIYFCVITFAILVFGRLRDDAQYEVKKLTEKLEKYDREKATYSNRQRVSSPLDVTIQDVSSSASLRAESRSEND